MADNAYAFERLSTRDGFNQSLRHFKAVNEIVVDFEAHVNLADILDELLADKQVLSEQVVPVLNALLVDKYKYRYQTHNMTGNFADFGKVAAEVKKWTAVDVVVAYFHPELGPLPINPRNEDHWQSVQSLRTNEMLTVYCGRFEEGGSKRVCEDAARQLLRILETGKVGRTLKSLTKDSLSQKQASRPAEPVLALQPRAKAAPDLPKQPQKKFPVPGALQVAASGAGGPETPTAASQPEGRPKKMTPMYSIPVTNELFHNGNVEAWKKIIESYRAKYAGLDVYIFYDGERIHDINTLFKWGKVKHGSAILISVGGNEILDVTKLQKYLRQGASSGFEAFLKFPVNTVLSLF